MQTARPRLHIIANCTNRKRSPARLELGSIPGSDVKKRAVSWCSNLSNGHTVDTSNRHLFGDENETTEAGKLYAGGYWSIIRELPEKAKSLGFDSQLWILSAGYGLISSWERIRSYSATFTQGDKDSVIPEGLEIGKRQEILSDWWTSISECKIPGSSNPRSLAVLFRKYSEDYFLVVTSQDYLTAIENDLLEGVRSVPSTENVVVITSRSHWNEELQKCIIPADARLQCGGGCDDECHTHLIRRGIRGTISALLAGIVIEAASESGFRSSQLTRFVENRIEASPALVGYNRTRLSDDEVNCYIDAELGKMPSASCSFLLRKLRDGGRACEQKRFKELYWAAKRSHP